MWRKIKISALVLSLFFVLPVAAQTKGEVYRYEKASGKIKNSLVTVDWQGDAYTYRWEGEKDWEYHIGNARTKRKKSSFLLSDLKEAMAAAGAEGMEDWKLYSFKVDTLTREVVHYSWKGKPWTYNYKKKEAAEKEVEDGPEKTATRKSFQAYWKKFNADSTAFIFTKGHQLHFYSDASDTVRLSEDGERYFSYSSSGNSDVPDTAHYGTTAVWSKEKVVALREDRREIPELSVVDNLAQPYPKLRTYKFPLPGDSAVSNYVLDIWDIPSKEHTSVPIAQKDQERIITPGQLVNGRVYLFAPRWGEEEAELYFLRRNRQNNKVELCVLDEQSLEVKVLVEEVVDPHLNEQLFTVHILNNGEDILFWSEESGYGRFHHYDRQGKFLNKIGPEGKYVTGLLYDYEEEKRSLILEVYGFQSSTNPYYKQYLRADLDTEDGELLTAEPYSHSIALSPDKKYFVDTYSNPMEPPFHVIKSREGKVIDEIGQADIEDLKNDLGWKAPELVKVKAGDGKTFLYGLVYTPYDLDESKKYPVIASVYPGPQADYVPHSFSVDDNYHQTLADLGFVVVQVPSRGSSPYRGLEFHAYSYGNMRDYALEDNKLGIEELAAERPYFDLNRVGVFGHSGGGFMSATALMTYPDFYKVAVAASGNYDPNIYTQWWSETYHGLNAGKPSQPYIPTSMELAERLEGKLLLITGDVDINVHPAHTLRLADALIKADKYFDMMILPGKDHGLGDTYYQNLINNYFLLHLKGKDE